jgi:hypothetical protein
VVKCYVTALDGDLPCATLPGFEARIEKFMASHEDLERRAQRVLIQRAVHANAQEPTGLLGSQAKVVGQP